MKLFNAKKCPLCGQPLRKEKEKLLCAKCQVEIKGDTIHLNVPNPADWKKT
ncbi:MAG: hypothetical protein L0Y74_08215 [candidate division Zixibacteria bacterium]|nr:hypothetical protein [candidate division Zixibacteria bacterium]